MVAPPVMAFRKQRHRVDRRILQRLLPPALVKPLPDPCNVGRRVKIEVDLAVAKLVHGREAALKLPPRH